MRNLASLILFSLLASIASAQTTGYNVPSSCGGLVCIIGPGTTTTPGGVIVTWAGGNITVTANVTNYIYLDNTGTLIDSTVGFAAGGIPIALVTFPNQVLTIADERTSYNFTAAPGAAAGAANTIPVPNCTSAGTVLNEGVQLSSQVVGGVTQACVTTAASSSTAVFGVCSNLNNGVCGSTGTAQVAYLGLVPGIFDGGPTTINDLVTPSATAGQFTDVGLSPPSTGQTVGRVYTVNTGAGTAATINWGTGDINQPGSSGGSGTVNNAAFQKIAYYSTNPNGKTVSGDVCTTDGSGNISACNSVTVGTAGTAGTIGAGASTLNVQNSPNSAATAGTTITLGSGATNANAVNTGSGATTLAMTLNINVGDFVIVFTASQDQAVTLTDNGAGGGNTYTRLGPVGTNYGQETMWYIQSATVSASSLTASDAANVYTMAGATYLHVVGIGLPINPVYQTSDSLSMSSNTIGVTSLLVGAFDFKPTTVFTAVSGTIVASSFNNTNTINIGLMSIATTTVGNYTLSANTSIVSEQSNGLAVELLSTGTTSAPLVKLVGNGWTGSASVASSSTLQGVVPAIPNSVPVVTVTPSLSVVNNNAGFSNSLNVVNGPYLQSVVNGSAAQTEYSAIGQPGSQTTALYGGIIIPATANQHQTNGIFGSITTSSTSTNAVAGYFSGRALAPTTNVWGFNSLASDSGLVAHQLIGAEMDINQSAADAVSVRDFSEAIRIISGGTHRPAAGIYIAGATGNTNFLAPIVIDNANSTDTNTTRMIYLIPQDNLDTTTGFQWRNHANSSDVLTMTNAGRIKPSLYGSLTNCAATGTAANPSVASCTAAPAGSVACSTSASTGTCTVNTTAVTASSEIFLSQRTDTTTGTTLSVTCNTTKDTNSTSPQITAVTAATSFTFQLGTFNTNPECFSYWIIN